jgi:hypothetical protein
MLIREEQAAYIDGLSAMDFDMPNARDVSNAFGNGLSSIPNSLGA